MKASKRVGMEKCGLTHTETLWCRRLASVMHARPNSLEVHVGINTVDIAPAGTGDAVFERDGHLDKIGEESLYTIITKVQGDGSAL